MANLRYGAVDSAASKEDCRYLSCVTVYVVYTCSVDCNVDRDRRGATKERLPWTLARPPTAALHTARVLPPLVASRLQGPPAAEQPGGRVVARRALRYRRRSDLNTPPRCRSPRQTSKTWDAE